MLDQISSVIFTVRDDLLKGQSLAVSSLREEISGLRADVTGELKELKTGLTEVSDAAERNRRRLDELEQRVSYLEEENKEMKHRQVDSENRDKKNNLVLLGVPESVVDNALENEFLCICDETLKVGKNVSIERIHRVGNKTVRRPRSVVIKFLDYKDRELVWSKRRNLRGTKLYLEEHFAVEIQQRRQQLLPYLQAARKRGEKAIMFNDTLLIGGQRFSAEQADLRSLQLRYGEEQTRSQIEVETDQGPAICFYGRHSPFSNFFLAPVQVSGKTFPSSEHFYTCRKCEISDRMDLAYRSTRAKYPVQATAIGRPVTLENGLRLEVMRTGLMAKFEQNAELKKQLIETGDKMLVEVSPIDQFWGAGCGLSSNLLKTPNKWSGRNEMGKMLMQLRSEFVQSEK